jgi:hypothetical protein
MYSSFNFSSVNLTHSPSFGICLKASIESSRRLYIIFKMMIIAEIQPIMKPMRINISELVPYSLMRWSDISFDRPINSIIDLQSDLFDECCSCFICQSTLLQSI